MAKASIVLFQKGILAKDMAKYLGCNRSAVTSSLKSVKGDC